MKHTKPTIRNDEKGLVSFVVVIIIMIILTLLVMGFSNLSRREQRQSLDRQLQTQAFYAAESGINEAVKILEDSSLNPSAIKDSCDNTGDWSGLDARKNLSGDNVIEYSCILVDSRPSTLELGGVGSESKVIPIQLVDDSGNPISSGGAGNTITVKWKSSTAVTPATVTSCDGTASNSNYTQLGAWNCDVGLLRIDFVSTHGGSANDGQFTRQQTLQDTTTLFVHPGTNGSPNYPHGNPNVNAGQGTKAKANCDAATGECTVNITSVNWSYYMMRLRTVYGVSDVTISSTPGIRFANAQTVIDATGRANDVLRRVRVRYSDGTITTPLLADYTIESNSICKRYLVVPDDQVVDPAGDNCGF